MSEKQSLVAYSTVRVSRKTAVGAISDGLCCASNEDIADILLFLYRRQTLHNYDVVDYLEEDEDDHSF